MTGRTTSRSSPPPWWSPARTADRAADAPRRKPSSAPPRRPGVLCRTDPPRSIKLPGPGEDHVPELPEVEVVRFGLAEHVAGRTISAVEVRHPRAVRRHVAGELDFAARLAGRELRAARRRGNYLWLELTSPEGAGPGDAGPDEAVLAHLGMSGQLRLQPPGAADETHLRVR